MIHLSSFAAVHYRGLDGLSIPRLSAANLVTGANGIGKTALLEAIWRYVGRPNCIIEGTKYQKDDFDRYLQYYSEMVRDSREDELSATLNSILPGIRGIEILIDESSNRYLSAVTADGKQLPVDQLGSGFVRLLRISLSMFMSRYGILLADEMETASTTPPCRRSGSTFAAGWRSGTCKSWPPHIAMIASMRRSRRLMMRPMICPYISSS